MSDSNLRAFALPLLTHNPQLGVSRVSIISTLDSFLPQF